MSSFKPGHSARKHARAKKRQLSTWVSKEDWDERFISFNASWFTCSMGTGVMAQIWVNFPYHGEWQRTIAYIFWVLSIVLFVFFTLMGSVRGIRYPQLTREIMNDFYQTSFLGAIPITIDVIAVGFVLFYNNLRGVIWFAYGLYWVATLLSIIVGCIVVFVTCAYQEAPELSSVNGVWLLSFIPFIVTSGTGAIIIPHLPTEVRGATIVISFLLWSLGISMSMIIITIYFWRLIRHKLPPRDAIVSSFIPMGPSGMGSYSIQNIATAMAAYIMSTEFELTLNAPGEYYASISSDVEIARRLAIAASIHWMGILLALFLISFSTFWLLQGVLSVSWRAPKTFNVGFWSFVFPNAVYTNGLCRLAQDLDNKGLRGWAAAMVVATTLLWIGCAGGTFYKAVWHGELLFAPGLEGWNEKNFLKERQRRRSEGAAPYAQSHETAGTPERAGGGESAGDAELDGEHHVVTRTSRVDGTYEVVKIRGGSRNSLV